MDKEHHNQHGAERTHDRRSSGGIQVTNLLQQSRVVRLPRLRTLLRANRESESLTWNQIGTDSNIQNAPVSSRKNFTGKGFEHGAHGRSSKDLFDGRG